MSNENKPLESKPRTEVTKGRKRGKNGPVIYGRGILVLWWQVYYKNNVPIKHK